MDKDLFTSGETASQVGLPRWRLIYLVERGDLPGPSKQVPGRRLFTLSDIRNIAKALNDRTAMKERG